MLYEDRVSIATPEGVLLDLTLANVGSRFLAAVVDTTLQVLLLFGLWLIGAAVGGSGSVVAVLLVLSFLVFFAYDVLFETLASGRTPGKRLVGLRVVREGGGPVTFTVSAVRNLLRLVDILPGSYLIGIVCIFLTRRNQRLGDLAAGTLVVRETRRATGDWHVDLPPPPPDAAGWDTTGVSAEDLATLRRFLERRDSLLPAARARLAADLAGRPRSRVVGPHEGVDDERFIAFVVAVKVRPR